MSTKVTLEQKINNKDDNYLEYSDYWYLCCYNHNVSAVSAFLRCFMSNLSVHTESWTETFICTTGVDCLNSVKHDQVQVLRYSKYYLLFLPGIETVTARWFH